MASAVPPPIFEPFGQRAAVFASTNAFEHVLKPLPDMRSVLGMVIVSFESVRFVSGLTTTKWIDEFFGFFLVPAFAGLTVTVSLGAVADCASATAAPATTITAASAATRILRKMGAPRSCGDTGRGRLSGRPHLTK